MTILAIALVMICLGSVSAADENQTVETVNENSQYIDVVMDEQGGMNADDAIVEDSDVGVSNEDNVLGVSDNSEPKLGADLDVSVVNGTTVSVDKPVTFILSDFASIFDSSEVYLQFEGEGYYDNKLNENYGAAKSTGAQYTFEETGTYNVRLLVTSYGTSYFTDYVTITVEGDETPISEGLIIRDRNNPNKDVITIDQNYDMILEYKLNKPDMDISTEEIIFYINGAEEYRNSTFTENKFTPLGTLKISEEGEFEFKLVYRATLSDGTVYTKESNTVKVISNIQEQVSDIIKIRDADYPNQSTITINDAEDKVTVRIQYYLEKPSYWISDEKITFTVGGSTNVIQSPTSGSWVGAFQFSLNESAEFTIKAVYSGTDIFSQNTYNEQSNTIKYSIKFKGDKEISISNGEVDYGTKADLSVTGSDGDYTVVVDGKNYDVTVVDGTGNVVIDVLDANTYDVEIISKDDDSLRNSSTLKVNPISPDLKVSSSKNNYVYGGLTTISISKNANAKGAVKVFDGEQELTNLKNIKFSAGTHTIKAKYSADGNFIDDEDEITITVKKAKNDLTLTVTNETYPDSVTITLKATVPGTYDVVIGLDTYKLTVGKNGVATKTVKLTPGSYVANVNYDGNDNYSENKAKTSFNVLGNTVKLNATVSSNTIELDDSVTISSSVKETDAEGKVTYKFDDGTKDVIADIGEIVSYTPKTVGEHTITVSYDDGIYDPETLTLTVNVNKKQNRIKVDVASVKYPNKVTVKVTADVAGEYTVNINGTKYVVTANGKGKSIALDAGSYYANVTYTNDKYAGIITNTTFKVNKGVNNVKIESEDVTLPSESVIKITADVAGTYSVKIGDKTENVNIPKNGASSEISIKLDDGTYKPTIVNYLNKNYDLKVSSNEFTVNPLPISANLSIRDGNYPKNSELEVEMPYNFLFEYSINRTDLKYDSEKIIIYCNDEEFTTVEDVSTGDFHNIGGYIKLTEVESLEFYAVWQGIVDGETFTQTSNKIKFNVIPASSDMINIRDGNLTLLRTIDVTVDDEYSIYMEYMINNPSMWAGNGVVFIYANAIDDDHLIATVSSASNDANYHNIGGLIKVNETVDLTFYAVYMYSDVFEGNNQVTSSPLVYHIKIKEPEEPTSVSVSVGDVTYPSAAVAIVESNKDGAFVVSVGGKSYDANVVNGVAKVKLDVLNAGSYDVNVVSKDDSGVKNSSSFVVNPTSPDLKISSSKNNYVYGELTTISISKNANAKGTVKIFDGEQELTNLNNIKFSAGTHTIKAKYAADGNFLDDEDEITITVKKAKNDLTLTVTNETYPDKVTITLKASVPGTYDVIVGEDTYKLTVGKNGVATKAVKLIPGSYVANVNYVGNANYSANKAKTSFNVLGNIAGLDATVSSKTIDVDSAVTLNSSVKETDAAGKVTYKFDDGTEDVIADIGEIVSYTPKTVGKHTITVSYDDGVYDPEILTLNVNVNKKQNRIKVDVTSVKYPNKVTVKVTADVAGKYTVNINGTNYVVTANGKGKSIALDAGSYYANVTYSNDKYVGIITNTTFKVDKGVNNVKIESSDVTLPSDALIKVTADVAGTYSVKIGDKTENVNIPKNGASSEISIKLDEGTYKPSIINYLDKNYDLKVTSNKFTVNPEPIATVVSVSVGDVTYPSAAVVTVESKKDGAFVVTVGGKSYDANVVDGVAKVKLDVLDAGSYDVSVVSKDDANVKDSTKLTVKPAEKIKDYSITAEVANATEGETKLIVSVPKDATGHISVKIGDKVYSAPIENGKATVDLSDLKAGKHNAEITYPGDEKYASNTAAKSISVETKEIIPTIISSDMTRGWNSGMDFNATFKDAKGKPLSNTEINFKINDKTYNIKTNEMGVAVLNEKLAVGNYVVISINPVTGEQSSNNLSIVKRILNNKDITMDYYSGVYFKVKAIGDDGKAAHAGETVYIKVNGKTYSCKTDSNGIAKLIIRLKPKSYTITAKYKGFTTKNKLVVKQILKSSNVKVKKSAKKLTLKATLKSTKGKAIKGKTIKFIFKGKTYKAKTNKKGIAQVVIKKSVLKKLKVGKKYTLKVRYIQDTIKKTITVKK